MLDLDLSHSNILKVKQTVTMSSDDAYERLVVDDAYERLDHIIEEEYEGLGPSLYFCFVHLNESIN